MNDYERRQAMLDDISPRRRARKEAEREARRNALHAIIGMIITAAILSLALMPRTAITYSATEEIAKTQPTQLAIARTAKVTGYNTIPEQTDSTPCIAASGDDICGRRDVAACPRDIALGTTIIIDEKQYICLDRLAKKFDNRFDISCDKDRECPYQITGTKEVLIMQ